MKAADNARIRFSLIIPAFNEEAYLPRLLDTVDAARARYEGGPGAIEVVVADNASTDTTAALARERGCQVAYVEKRAIAASRNGGARIAQGEVFAFVDADSQIHPDVFNAIDRALATGKVVGGATGVKLDRMSLGIAMSYAMMVPLVWLTNMDTGVVFCRREDFEEIGGYNEKRLFAEDVELLLALIKRGRTRGQKLVRVRSVKTITSTRKWDKHGEWHYFGLMFRAACSPFLSAKTIERWAREYWYEDRK